MHGGNLPLHTDPLLNPNQLFINPGQHPQRLAGLGIHCHLSDSTGLLGQEENPGVSSTSVSECVLAIALRPSPNLTPVFAQ